MAGDTVAPPRGVSALHYQQALIQELLSPLSTLYARTPHSQLPQTGNRNFTGQWIEPTFPEQLPCARTVLGHEKHEKTIDVAIALKMLLTEGEDRCAHR